MLLDCPLDQERLGRYTGNIKPDLFFGKRSLIKKQMTMEKIKSFIFT